MYLMKALPFTLFTLLCSMSIIVAIPVWEGMNGRSSIGALNPGASFIEARGPAAYGESTKHLAVHKPDQFPANLTMSPNYRAPPLYRYNQPPLFYVNQNQLWLLVNETAVYPVNVHNTTSTHELPMQLILGRKKEGITHGTWKWQGTMLFYDLPGQQSNDGVFFQCSTSGEINNVFMSPMPAPAPDGCQMMTLHSFTEVRLRVQSK